MQRASPSLGHETRKTSPVIRTEGEAGMADPLLQVAARCAHGKAALADSGAPKD